MFKFTDEQLAQALDDWIDESRQKNAEIIEYHEDYLRATVLTFLYSRKSLQEKD